jgi:hypothetical protein
MEEIEIFVNSFNELMINQPELIYKNYYKKGRPSKKDLNIMNEILEYVSIGSKVEYDITTKDKKQIRYIGFIENIELPYIYINNTKYRIDKVYPRKYIEEEDL